MVLMPSSNDYLASFFASWVTAKKSGNQINQSLQGDPFCIGDDL